jgi:hypothetical protein
MSCESFFFFFSTWDSMKPHFFRVGRAHMAVWPPHDMSTLCGTWVKRRTPASHLQVNYTYPPTPLNDSPLNLMLDDFITHSLAFTAALVPPFHVCVWVCVRTWAHVHKGGRARLQL